MRLGKNFCPVYATWVFEKDLKKFWKGLTKILISILSRNENNFLYPKEQKEKGKECSHSRACGVRTNPQDLNWHTYDLPLSDCSQIWPWMGLAWDRLFFTKRRHYWQLNRLHRIVNRETNMAQYKDENDWRIIWWESEEYYM